MLPRRSLSAGSPSTPCSATGTVSHPRQLEPYCGRSPGAAHGNRLPWYLRGRVRLRVLADILPRLVVGEIVLVRRISTPLTNGSTGLLVASEEGG